MTAPVSLRTMIVVGTRPDAIKMYPVLREARDRGLDAVVVSTAQHDDLLERVFAELGFRPDLALGVMEEDQQLAALTGRLLHRLDEAVRKVEPGLVLVQGDTTSSMAGALVAFYHRVPVGHVEAGLRTGDPARPFPEEINRRMITPVADLHFAPTARARGNLRDEGIEPERIVVTGNTAIDALLAIRRLRPAVRDSRLAATLAAGGEIIAVTAHRRESFGKPFQRFLEALRAIAEAREREDVQIVYPVHPNPSVRGPVSAALEGMPGIVLLDPLGYGDLVRLLEASRLILTDSGGIQEEAPSLGKPVVVLRERTERMESIRAGIAVLVGMDRDRIVETVIGLLSDPARYEAMVPAGNPYGDGRAAARIVAAIRHRYCGEEERAVEFGGEAVGERTAGRRVVDGGARMERSIMDSPRPVRSLVVIPTYNERENLPALVTDILGRGELIDVLIVDDNSPDGTGRMADGMAEDTSRVRVIHRTRKLGLGSAYIEGFKYALKEGYDCVFEMDADFSHNPEYIDDFLAAAEESHVVIGSRYLRGVNVVNWPMLRLIISYCAGIYTRLITGLPIRDPTSGFKCFRREALEAIDLDRIYSDGYSFQIEMNYWCWRKGFRIREIPIIFIDRDSGASKMNRRIIIEAIFIVWWLRIQSLLGRI